MNSLALQLTVESVSIYKETTMIIKHIVELETVINEEISNPAVMAITSMSETERNQFFQEAGEAMVADFVSQANEGNSWALLRVVKKELI